MDFAGLTKKNLTEEDIKLKYITPAYKKQTGILKVKSDVSIIILLVR